MLRQHGFELRRPYTDILRDEIHELRAHLGTVQYRILFFFHEHSAVLSHGLVKKKATVPDKEIDLAVVRKTKYRANPDVHRCKEQLP
jgi:phage-related protein